MRQGQRNKKTSFWRLMLVDIGDPDLIRTGCGEVTLHQVAGSTHGNQVTPCCATLMWALELQFLLTPATSL